MAYKRQLAPDALLAGAELTAALAGIGMNFAIAPWPEPNVEDALMAASEEGMEQDDLRVLGMLVTWLGVHHAAVNADWLVRAVRANPSPRVKAFWAAMAAWLSKDRRLSRLAQLSAGPPLDLLRSGNDYQIQRKGEDTRFQGGPLRVPAGVLRDRASDVLPPAELARISRTYRNRILMGPTYRADMWTALERDPSLTPAELARRAHGSFATAWEVKRNWELLEGSGR